MSNGGTPAMTPERLADIEDRAATPHFMAWSERQEIDARQLAIVELVAEVKRLWGAS